MTEPKYKKGEKNMKNRAYLIMAVLFLVASVTFLTYSCGGGGGGSSGSSVPLPSAPSGLTANVISPTAIILSWTDNSNNEDGFKIESSLTSGSGFAQIDTVSSGITSYTNAGLTANIPYYYRVRAYNSAGNSAYTTEASATITEIISAPAIPSGPAAGLVYTSYDYTASGSTSDFGHQVEYQFDWGGTWSVWSSLTTVSNSWSVTGTQLVRARARCITHTSIVSGWSSELSVVIATKIIGTCNTPNSARGVYVAGNYAYVADEGSGLQIIDISNPANPVTTGSVATPNSASDIYVSGNYAYVADYGSGLQVIDISNPANPVITGSINTGGGTSGVYVSGYAYVADDETGLHIIDISNPANPVSSGSIAILSGARDVVVSGTYAYVVCANDLKVVDISNPANPTISGSCAASGYGVYVSGNYAYVAGWSLGLRVVDISNPVSPAIVGTYDTPGNAYGVYVSGNYAYVADWAGSGLKIIDITTPATPTLAGSIATASVAMGVYISGNYAYVADGYAGLQIISIEDYLP
jgi:hypothetical protein